MLEIQKEQSKILVFHKCHKCLSIYFCLHSTREDIGTILLQRSTNSKLKAKLCSHQPSQWWARRSHPEQESSVTWQQSQCSHCGDINNSSGGSHWLQDRGNKDRRGELNNLRAGGETVWEDKVSRRSLSRPTFQLNVNVGRHAKGTQRKQGCLLLDFHSLWHNRVVTYNCLYLTSET